MFGCLPPPPSHSPPRAPAACGAFVVALEPEQGRTLRGAEARNWSPVYRERETRRPAPCLDPGSVQADGFTVRFAKDTRYHRLVVADDDDTPLPPFRQLVPERDVDRPALPYAL